ncbi:unnamed protein product [Rotaria sordida]|nr:unnamed protein product [Rotaria sordida]CAF0766113.1 unnamed protein product [Rotaria sordida]CAF0803130.1 unnamed protein product [Rotaria sordida]CAF0804361.1 unnamed protein product [Rotaria sordida]CAF0809823.1 unnamed protein product [Rotaria sordida]
MFEEPSKSLDEPTTSTDDSKKDYGTNKCMQILCTRSLLCSAIYFALAYFIQGITDIASGFVNLPLQTILKDRLHLSPSQMGTFFFTCTVTWSIKPLYGILSDFVPICGYHRLIYLLVTTAINLCAWIALYFAPTEYNYLLIFCVLAAFSLAFNDVLIDALMISIGRPLALIGTLQGIQQTSAKLAATISQIPAGILASNSVSFQYNQTLNNNNNTLKNIKQNSDLNKYIFLIAAACPIILFFATLITVRERRRKLNKNNFTQTWSILSGIFQYKRFWIIAIFLFIYSASPQIKTALFYYQRDKLHFNPFYVSILNTLYNGCGILSALLYLSIFSHYPTKRVLRIAIVMRIFAVASYLFAIDKMTSICVAIITGFCSEITNLAILHLAAKSCPKNIEGTLFALFVSCVNFGAATGDWLGSIIYQYLGFIALIIIAIIWIGTTILVTCHINEHGINSTPDDDDEIDDKYHYYNVIEKQIQTIENEDSDDKETNCSSG